MAMYLTTQGGVVGRVEKGHITETYSLDETLESVINGDADTTDTSMVGERATALGLVKLVERPNAILIKQEKVNTSKELSPATTLKELRGKLETPVA